MSGKYREMFRGDYAPRVALSALNRKVSTLARSVKEADEREKARTAAAEAAAALRAADSDLLYVTRAELREAVESGEVPEAWTAPADPDGSADG